MPPAVARDPTASVTEPRQCWECLRRRWVCDAARPVCNKCRNAGIVCPGYNDTKPLTWLAPGRVTSRARKKKKKPKDAVTKKKATTDDIGSKARKNSAIGNELHNAAIQMKENDEAMIKKELDAEIPLITTNLDEISDNTSSSHPSSAVDIKNDPGFDLSLEEQFLVAPPPLDLIPDSDLNEAINYCELKRIWGKYTFTTFHRSVFAYPSSAVPGSIANSILDNTHIYPSLKSNQLEPNPFVVPIVCLPQEPGSLRHALISMTLSHRIMQIPEHQRGSYPWNENAQYIRDSSSLSPTSNSSTTPPTTATGETDLTTITDSSTPRSNELKSGPDSAAAKAKKGQESAVSGLLLRLHYHTGQAIRHLTEEIGTEATRSSDATITSVIVLLIAEVSGSHSPFNSSMLMINSNSFNKIPLLIGDLMSMD